VVEGCEVSPQGGNLIAVSGGTAVVNGKVVHVNAVTNLPVTVPNAQTRFDLIVVNELGTVQVNPGDQVDDPFFPDPELNQTVLAAVYCTATSSDYSSNIIDKRKFLPSSLFAKMPVGDDLIRNLNNSGNHYRVTGDGKTVWEDDTILERQSAQTLRVTNNLHVVNDLAVGDDLHADGAISADGVISGSNLRRGTSIPVGSFQPGDLFQNVSSTSGRLYLWVGPHAGGSWQELTTSASSVPIGTIIMSLAPPASLAPFGWCPMDGKKHYESDFPGLFSIPALVPLIQPGPAPRGMIVPNLNKRMLMVDDSGVGKTGGVNNGVVTLTKANLPAHKHGVGIAAGGGFTPKGTVTPSTPTGWTVTGGRHQHKTVDPGHRHAAADLGGAGTQVIAVHDEDHFGPSDPGGQNKIDALFNDRSHTFSVEAMSWTMPAKAGTAVSGDLSDHTHGISGGAHGHVFTGTAVPDHSHVVDEDTVGEGAGFSVMPAYYTVYAYIKG